MKKLVLFVCLIAFGITACVKNDCGCVSPPNESTCIETKIFAMQTANKDYTSVKRLVKNNQKYWLFDTGSAFDAPQYLLNSACDTVCTWTFRSNALPCQSNFSLNDSTAVVIWKK
jgi:hypothetical protein